MTDRASEIVERIRALEDDLEEEFRRRRKTFMQQAEKGRIVFGRDALREQRALREKLMPYVAKARPMVVLTAPVIYAVIVPIVLLDVFVALYQGICFPVYGIEKVRRRDYITFDRQHLSYLNGLEKLNCLYCSYANGLLAYVSEIAGRTEKHWCPIKHARRMEGTHRHYHEFADFGDASSYRQIQNSPERLRPRRRT